jgi:D-glycero-D-manno-heptose 1,7-bisphosphate phosphatase
MSNKAIFLDRDDTLIEDPGYISSPEQVKLLPGTAQALMQLKQMGYKLIVVSNQSGIARGMFTEDDLIQIHGRMKELLAAEGAYLDQIYYCPYHPEGVIEKYRRESDLRKPNPGMLLTAAEEIDIDLGQSWMIGNEYHDTTAGKRVGCRTVLLNLPPGVIKTPKSTDPSPDFKAVNLKEAANIIRRYSQSPRQQQPPPSPPPAERPSEPAPPSPPLQLKPAEQSPQKKAVEVQEHPSMHTDRTEQLLEHIVKLLRTSQREEMFSEFSLGKLLAGCLQIVVVFCLLISLWFLMSTSRNVNAITISLGFAIVFQLMALTFYIIQNRK